MAYRILRILLRVFASFIALLIVLAIVLSFSSVQTFIAKKITDTFHEKTGEVISIGSLKIAFLKKIEISDIYIQDQKDDTLLFLHSLKVEFHPLDILRNKINVDRLYLDNLVSNIYRKNPEDNFNFQFIVDSLFPQKSDTASEPGVQWKIQVKNISLQNIRATLIDEKSDINDKLVFDNFELTVKNFDLNKKLLSLDRLFLKNASMQMLSTQVDTIEKTLSANDKGKNDIKNSSQSDIFLDWHISADQLSIEGSDFLYDNKAYPVLPDEFDYNHIQISKLFSSIRSIEIFDGGYKAEIDTFNFSERCGFRVEKFSTDAQLTEQTAELKHLIFETSQSKISADAKLSYKTFYDLLNAPGNCEVFLDLKYADVNPQDVLLIKRSLETDTIISKFKNNDISIKAKADGKISDLKVDNFEISLLQKTELKTHGRLIGLPDVSKLRFSAEVDLLSTILPDVYQFIDSKSLAGINLPQSIELIGNINGKMDSLSADIQVNSDNGSLAAKGYYRNRSDNSDTINLIFNAKDIHAGHLISDTTIGKVGISGNVSTVRDSSGLFYGSSALTIDEVHFNSYDYKNIIINSRMDGKIFSAVISSADTNVSFELNADLDLNEEKKKYSADLNISNVNMHALNFTKDKLSFTTNLKANLNYARLSSFDSNLELLNTSITSEGKKTPLKKFELNARSDLDELNIQVNSEVIDGTISGNISADKLENSFKTAFQKYLYGTNEKEIEPGRHLSLMMNVHAPKEIMHLVSKKIEVLNISKVEGQYSSDNNNLSFEMQVPKVIYADLHFDTVSILMNGENDELSLEINSDKIAYKSFSIEGLRIKESTDKGKVLSRITVEDSTGSMRYLFANEMEFGKELNKLRFLPGGLVLDGESWNVDEGNSFVMYKNKIDSAALGFSAEQFIFSSDDQSFGIVSEGGNQKLEFKNFALGDLTNIFIYQRRDSLPAYGSKLIKGNVDGDIVFAAAGNTDTLNSKLMISNIYVQDSLAGNLSLNIAAGKDKMDINAKLENKANAVSLTGDVDHLADDPSLNLIALVEIKDFHQMERLALGALSNTSGRIEGKLSIKGTMKSPVIDGYLGFDETAFKINSLNFFAKINHEKITVENKRIHFDNFIIEDTMGRKLNINGEILTSDLSNLAFDLNISSKKYQPMNSTKADNKVFYGKLSIETDIKLKGNLDNPNIDANIKIDSITDLTYELPGSELKLITPEGIVQFVDSSQSIDSILAAAQIDYMRDSIISRLKGFKFRSHIEVDPGAKFTVFVDPKSGDYLTLNGAAKLDIYSDGEGNQSVNGIYEVNSGSYQLSFYDLVKKNFTIKPGSTVVWSGQPMDAVMNITAEYIVRTSSVALVANESSSMSEEEKKVFNKRLPYEVKLNIRGFISKPEISFNISLPNQYLSDNPIVASKLAQLNTPEMTDQLNKQVFALLVTGGFIAENPMSTGNTSNNIASTAARNSVNGILSNQMNNMSGKYITGVDVNFGLNSYEDYSTSSGETRTDLDVQISKKLFNDRLEVEAENSFGLNSGSKNNKSSNTQQGYGQFAVIYSLTESGEYKLRAYYQNAYDPFDGEISYSGIAFIFEKELDSLKPGGSGKEKVKEKDKVKDK